MAADTLYLNAPIPGMSLTTEPGDRPWENPPSMATVDEALEFYTNRILGTKENHEELLDIIESGLPIRNIAGLFNKINIMQGRHTIDVGMLVMPAIEELIMAVADMYGVEYDVSVDDIIKNEKVSRRQARLALKEARQKSSQAAPEVEEEQPRGLMAKPNKDMVE